MSKKIHITGARQRTSWADVFESLTEKTLGLAPFGSSMAYIGVTSVLVYAMTPTVPGGIFIFLFLIYCAATTYFAIKLNRFMNALPAKMLWLAAILAPGGIRIWEGSNHGMERFGFLYTILVLACAAFLVALFSNVKPGKRSGGGGWWYSCGSGCGGGGGCGSSCGGGGCGGCGGCGG